MIRVDFRFPGTSVVVEALGYRWHRTGAQMNIDAERVNRLTMDGYLVLQFTYDTVVDRAQRNPHAAEPRRMAGLLGVNAA